MHVNEEDQPTSADNGDWSAMAAVIAGVNSGDLQVDEFRMRPKGMASDRDDVLQYTVAVRPRGRDLLNKIWKVILPSGEVVLNGRLDEWLLSRAQEFADELAPQEPEEEPAPDESDKFAELAAQDEDAYDEVLDTLNVARSTSADAFDSMLQAQLLSLHAQCDHLKARQSALRMKPKSRVTGADRQELAIVARQLDAIRVRMLRLQWLLGVEHTPLNIEGVDSGDVDAYLEQSVTM